MEFNPFLFTRSVSKALSRDNLEEAERIVRGAVEGGHLSQGHYRVTNALNTIKGYTDQKRRRDKLIADNVAISYDILPVKVRPPEALGGLPSFLHPDLPSGRYEALLRANPLIERINFEGCKKEEYGLFLKAGLDRSASLADRDTCFVEHNCRLSALGHDDSTVRSEEGYFHPSRSSRMAKLSRSVILAPTRKTINEAYILPFPHSAGNYFHSLSELAYGLRHLHLVKDDVPIIYDEDRFHLLPELSKFLKIEESRFTLRKDLTDCTIKTAYLPDSPSFYWSASLVGFFRSAAMRYYGLAQKRSKVYISRLGSKRAGRYEERLSSCLSDLGFDILQAQDLTISEQIQKFISASCIVAPHGAGMANAVFSPSTVRVVEVFNRDMISPDFAQRLKYVTADYHPIVDLDSDTVDRILDIVKS